MRILFFVFALFMFTSARSQDFPKKFTGHWKGDLYWYKTGEKNPQKVKMQLIIMPSDSAGHYTWQIIYGENNADNRAYILKPFDTAKGHWIVDERNGIILDQYWVGNKSVSAFTVQNSTIVDSYWIEGKKLIAEFYSISAKPINTTGTGNAEFPLVHSYGVKSYQKAVLRRVRG